MFHIIKSWFCFSFFLFFCCYKFFSFLKFLLSMNITQMIFFHFAHIGIGRCCVLYGYIRLYDAFAFAYARFHIAQFDNKRVCNIFKSFITIITRPKRYCVSFFYFFLSLGFFFLLLILFEYFNIFFIFSSPSSSTVFLLVEYYFCSAVEDKNCCA